MKKVASFALGCKVNQVESEAIAESFTRGGYEVVNIDEVADVYVINTCTVTNFGDKKSRQLIRRVKRQNPEAVVVVAGCYSQISPHEIKKIEGVNIVVGTKGKNDIFEAVESYEKEMGIVEGVSEIMEEKTFEPIAINKMMSRCRAYLKIQDGCNQFCSYCIIPYARGPIRSRPEEDIIKEVEVLARNGFKEVVLAGIHVASYGKELHTTNLLQVIEKIHPIEGIERIRFSSVEPNLITEEFMENLSKLKKVCHHFHLSLQSGSNNTLKAMNRKYTKEKYMEAVEVIRKYWQDAAITTDVIVGFPEESQEDFKESLEFVKSIGFSKVHVFPYSPKKGTPAEKMVQVEPQIKGERSKMLTEVAENMAEDFIEKHVGKVMEVLFEQESEEGVFEGHTSNYILVSAKSSKDLKNHICKVLIKSVEKGKAIGEIC